TLPLASVLVFPPTSVIAQCHLGLGVHGDLQRFGIVPSLLLHPLHVGENRVGLVGLFQRFTLLNPLEAVVHAVEDVSHGALAGQLLWGMALRDQGLAHLRCRQIRVPSRRLQFRIGEGMEINDRTDIRGQLRVLLFAAQPASRGEVLAAAHRLTRLVQSLQDRFSSPPEASFSLTGAALAKFPGHLGNEQPTLVSSQPSGSRADQGVEALGGSFHDGSLPWCRDSDRYGRSLASYHRGGEAQSRVDLDLPVALSLLPREKVPRSGG